MEVVNASQSMLTNSEMLEVLRENKKLGKEASRPAVVLEMESRVLKHIEDVGGKPYTTDQVAELLQRLSEVEPLDGQDPIKDTEAHNMANLRPTMLVEMYAVLDHAETRFGDDKLQDIIDLIEECLPPAEAK